MLVEKYLKVTIIPKL